MLNKIDELKLVSVDYFFRYCASFNILFNPITGSKSFYELFNAIKKGFE